MRPTALLHFKPAAPQPYKTSLILLAVVVMHLLVLWVLQNGAFKSIKPAEVVIHLSLQQIHPVQSSAPTSAHVIPTAKLQPAPQAAANSSGKSPAALLQAPLAVSGKTIETIVASADASHSTEHAIAAPIAAAATATAGVSVNPAAAPSSATTPNVAKSSKVQLPSTDADYLYSRKPKRSIQSEKMGDFGRVLIYTLISFDGVLLDAKIDKSSGFPRLDSSALEAVRTWRFKPGMVEGAPTTLPYIIPITFEP